MKTRGLLAQLPTDLFAPDAPWIEINADHDTRTGETTYVVQIADQDDYDEQLDWHQPTQHATAAHAFQTALELIDTIAEREDARQRRNADVDARVAEHALKRASSHN